ncbi:DMT family transporter [Candidatus Babeliales bacterium]|nr:DMT family transporter [Candidatus Babeliales bacterium]
MFLVVLLYAILASTFTIAKIALSYSQPFFIIGFRMTLAGILMMLYLYFFNNKRFLLKKEDIGLFLMASVFHVYLAFIPEFWALQFLSSSKVNLIYSATPFIAALLSYFLLSEKLGFKKFAGMMIGLFGLAPIFMTQSGVREALMEFASISIPEVVLLGAVTSAAYAWFIVKKLLNKGYSLLMINGFAMFIGGLGAFVTSFFSLERNKVLIKDFWPFLFWTLLLILVANIVVYNFYGWLIKHFSITFVTSAGFLCPIFGAFYGWFFLNEKITWHYFLSFVFVACGLYLFYKEEIKKRQKRNRII